MIVYSYVVGGVVIITWRCYKPNCTNERRRNEAKNSRCKRTKRSFSTEKKWSSIFLGRLVVFRSLPNCSASADDMVAEDWGFIRFELFFVVNFLGLLAAFFRVFLFVYSVFSSFFLSRFSFFFSRFSFLLFSLFFLFALCFIFASDLFWFLRPRNSTPITLNLIEFYWLSPFAIAHPMPKPILFTSTAISIHIAPYCWQFPCEKTFAPLKSYLFWRFQHKR